MACETIQDDNGHVIIFCGRSRRQRCKFCHQGFVAKLCDFPVAPGKTCDAGMCDQCATRVASEVDYCPIHKGQQPGPQQTSFFGDAA